MKRPVLIGLVVVALGIGFGGGYIVRGSVAAKPVMQDARLPLVVSDVQITESPTRTVSSVSSLRTIEIEATPKPTDTRRPTATPRPISTPRITATIKPSSTTKTYSKPTSTPSTYVINKNTRIFHLPNCYSVEKMKESNKEIRTNTRRETLMENYRPCDKCDP